MCIRDRCVGCGLCKQACPKSVIFLYPDAYQNPVVMCSSHQTGVDTRKECKSGCIGCGKCQRACPAQAITVRNFVARIDYDKCIGCQKCVDECPVHVIELQMCIRDRGCATRRQLRRLRLRWLLRLRQGHRRGRAGEPVHRWRPGCGGEAGRHHGSGGGRCV